MLGGAGRGIWGRAFVVAVARLCRGNGRLGGGRKRGEGGQDRRWISAREGLERALVVEQSSMRGGRG